MTTGCETVMSDEYHEAHLAFARVAIMEAHAQREPILDKIHRYTEDVRRAERDRLHNARQA
jgi:hypothetical protein